MGAIARELPHSFEAALKLAQGILSGSEWLVRRGSIPAEAEQIVIAAAGLQSRLELYSRIKDRLNDEAGQKVIVMAMARAEGKILQHLIGHQDFMDHRYEVGPEVLVPRPETEVLVRTAMERLSVPPVPEPRLGLEVGLGSGAISIELLCHFPALRMRATELTPEARALAGRNAARILPAPDRLQVLAPADPLQVLEPFLSATEERLGADFLISNPPYLQQDDPIDPDVVKGEPGTALFAPPGNPLHFYRAIAQSGHRLLRDGGQVFLEMPSFRAIAIEWVFRDNGWDTEILRDLAGEERILVARARST